MNKRGGVKRKIDDAITMTVCPKRARKGDHNVIDFTEEFNNDRMNQTDDSIGDKNDEAETLETPVSSYIFSLKNDKKC